MFKLFNMSFVGRPVQPVFIKLYCIHSSFCHGEWVGAPTVWIYIIHFVLIVEKVNWIMELLQPSGSCCIICIEVIGTSVYDINWLGRLRIHLPDHVKVYQSLPEDVFPTCLDVKYCQGTRHWTALWVHVESQSWPHLFCFELKTHGLSPEGEQISTAWSIADTSVLKMVTFCTAARHVLPCLWSNEGGRHHHRSSSQLTVTFKK